MYAVLSFLLLEGLEIALMQFQKASTDAVSESQMDLAWLLDAFPHKMVDLIGLENHFLATIKE